MNAMRIVVVGSGGRLGAAVARHFAGIGCEVLRLGRRAMKLDDLDEVRSVLGGAGFDVLVNCAAATSVDFCEDHEAEAVVVNGEAPGVMAEICEKKGARMVQVGTDYVYDGSHEGLKKETDLLKPLGVYARTKLDGDTRVLAVGERSLVLRVAWVFGPDRASFIDSILDRAVASDRVGAIADKVSSVCSSEEFGVMLERLLLVDGFGGVVNVCQRGACSWLEFARCGMAAAQECGIRFRAEEIAAMKLEEMGAFKAPRPRFTGMDTAKFTGLTGMEPMVWDRAVAAYVRDSWVKRFMAG